MGTETLKIALFGERIIVGETYPEEEFISQLVEVKKVDFLDKIEWQVTHEISNMEFKAPYKMKAQLRVSNPKDLRHLKPYTNIGKFLDLDEASTVNFRFNSKTIVRFF